jgi:hypothetical protein
LVWPGFSERQATKIERILHVAVNFDRVVGMRPSRNRAQTGEGVPLVGWPAYVREDSLRSVRLCDGGKRTCPGRAGSRGKRIKADLKSIRDPAISTCRLFQNPELRPHRTRLT